MPAKSAKNNLSIRLTESVVYLRGSVESTVMGRRSTRESPPAMLRGLLTLNLDKPTKISSIEITLEGKSQTTWPEGVGARRLEMMEEHEIFSATTVYFRAGRGQPAIARRTASVGPGLIFDREEDIEDDTASNGEPQQHQQQAGPSHPSLLAGSRRRVSMDYQYLHLSQPSPSSLDNIPTPPYSPPGTRPGSFRRNESGQSIVMPMPPIPHRSDSWLSAESDSAQSSRILEDQTVADQHGSLHNYPHLSREISEPHSSSSSVHSPSVGDLSLSRRESNEEPPVSADVSASERSRSRGRPRIPAIHTNGNGGMTHSRAPSVLRTPSTAPGSPYTPALVHPPVPPPSSSGSSQPHANSSTSSTSSTSILSHPHVAENDARTTSTSPHRERGSLHARFSLAMVSTVLLDAVKERVRSNSPRPRAGKERAVMPASRDHSPDGTRVSRVRNGLRRPSVDPETERGRSIARDEDGLKHKEKERSTLGRISGVLGLDVDGNNGDGDGWKEFRKGTYTYPISFAIPADSPPSLQCDFGSVSYCLRATVHRPGTFTHRLTATHDVTLIASPGEDDVDESDNIVVQREWDSQMHYMIIISGRAFPIGSIIPVHITFMPIAKVKIFRITAIVEEKVEYFTQFKRIARADVARKFELLSVRNPEKDAPPVLPLTSDYTDSPLHGLVDAPDESEAASCLLGPGPWVIQADLQLPKSCAKMHFTNKHKCSNIRISHILKIVFRVERGDDEFLDAKTGQRKHFDIVVQTPVHILSCRCNPEWTALPRYSCFASDSYSKSQACPCTLKQPDPTVSANVLGRTMVPPVAAAPGLSPEPSTASTHHTPFYTLLHAFELHADAPGVAYPAGQPLERLSSDTPTEAGSLYRRNTQFARLVAGEESELGEAPPQYERVASLENPHGALASTDVVAA